MAQLRDIVTYFYENNPYDGDFSLKRLSNMIYLADWKSAIERGEQITDLCWQTSIHGLDAGGLSEFFAEDGGFFLVERDDALGRRQSYVRPAFDPTRPVKTLLRFEKAYPSVDREQTWVLDFVKDTLERHDTMEFSRLIHSTYPMITGGRDGRKLDLTALAADYRHVEPTPARSGVRVLFERKDPLSKIAAFV